MYSKKIVAVVLAINGATVNAGGGCPEPTSVNEVVKCAVDRAPESQRAEGNALEAQMQTAAAAQLPNPELGADYLKGRSDSELTLSLQFPVTALLSRSAKISAAEALELAAKTQFKATQSRTKIAALLNLHRLRQHLREKELIDEALQTFAKLVKQYEARPQLPPEQEISLSVFRMAESDYKLQQLSLAQEEAKLRSFFLTATGLDLEQAKKALPRSVEPWPEYKAGLDLNSATELKIAQAELNRAEAEQRFARVSSWPELKAGPSFKRLNSGGNSSTSWGAGLGLSLPVFNWNGSERARAAQAKSNADLNLVLTKQELNQKRDELISVYRSSVQALKGMLSLANLTKNHERVERLFSRGIVTSSLVIEAHRSLVDLEKNRNEKELVALEALWSLRVIDGTALEEAI